MSKLNNIKDNSGEVQVNGITISFIYRLSPRKSYQITIFSDGRVLVRTPLCTSYKKVQSIIKEKADWINKKRAVFAACPPPVSLRYVNGSFHSYLGNNYLLQIIPAAGYMVSISGNNLFIESPYHSEEDIKLIIEKWYKRQAQEIFSTILDNCWSLFEAWGYIKPVFKVRKMRTRWGSMSSQGKMSLNLDLIKMPYKCIEYVIIHELCHLKHHNHGKGFYAALVKRLPDWKELKKILEESRHKNT